MQYRKLSINCTKKLFWQVIQRRIALHFLLQIPKNIGSTFTYSLKYSARAKLLLTFKAVFSISYAEIFFMRFERILKMHGKIIHFWDIYQDRLTCGEYYHDCKKLKYISKILSLENNLGLEKLSIDALLTRKEQNR